MKFLKMSKYSLKLIQSDLMLFDYYKSITTVKSYKNAIVPDNI